MRTAPLFPGPIAYTYGEHVADFVAAGIDVFRLSLPVGWVGPDTYDYGETDEMVSAFLAAGAGIRLFPLLWLDGAETKWWELAYPAERALGRSRATGGVVMDSPSTPRYARAGAAPTPDLDNFERYHGQAPCVHSFASRLWRAHARAALGRLLLHLERTFPGRFVGYYICAGLSYEWLGWGNYTDDVLFDYSEPMRRLFRDWLRHRYVTRAALSRAWHAPEMDFDAVEPPPPASRPARGADPLLDPREHTPAADFAAALSDAQADAFLDLCSAARAAVPSGCLVGGFYGYWWTQTDCPGPVRGGHLSLQRVLASPEVDFLASPYDYTNRGVDGVNSAQTLPGSARFHGMGYINSTDIKLAQDTHHWQPYVRVPASQAEAVELMKRDFAYSVAEGQDQSWVDLFGGAFRHRALRDALTRLQRISRDHPQLRRPPRAECLLVVDEESLRWTTPGAALTVPLFAVQKQWHLLRCGAPWTQLTLTDFLDGDWPDARVVYLVNAFRLDAATRERLGRRLAGRTAIWNLWPGLLDEEGAQLEHVRDLTGFAVEWLPRATGDWVFRTRAGAKGWPVGLEYGTGILRAECTARMQYYPPAEVIATAPRLGIRPEGVEALADWGDQAALSLARASHAGFTSVLNAGPLLPEAAIHALLGAAGAHLYTPPGDLVYANELFLAVYTGSVPTRAVRLRSPARVRDLYSGDWLTSGPVDALEMTAPRATTHLWQLCAADVCDAVGSRASP